MALQKGQAFRPEAYLSGTEGRMPTARRVTALAKCCAITLGQESLDDWHAGALDRWAQHSFRVAGAQFLARCGIDVAVIQLIGRWGSNAIFRYAQTAAFVPERAAQTVAQALGHPGSVTGSASSSPQHPPDAKSQNLRQLVCRIVNECILSKPVMVHNPRTPRTKIAHKPSTDEGVLDSSHWVTECGNWRYGVSRCVRNAVLLPGFQTCKNCFGSPQGANAKSASVISEESASDSSDCSG